MTTLIPVISDLQCPLHDERAVAAVATFLADRNLDSVCVGDELDAWQVSTWCKGRAGEFDGQLDAARNTTLEVMRNLRVRHTTRSNHTDRLAKYIGQYAPALAGLPELRLETFLQLDRIACTLHREPWEVTPGWLLVHGDEGPLVKSPGGTALGLALRMGMSIVCGHTHKMGMQHHTFSCGGDVDGTLWGFEVGHLMDMRKATYLGGGSANWQQGFGVLVVDGTDVTPVAVPIRDGRFTFDGKVYQA